jgi:tetratricopeptide (TPR) repeat protein
MSYRPALSLAFILLSSVSSVAAQNNPPQDKPIASNAEQAKRIEDAIAPYVKKARETLPEAKKKYLAGLPEDETFYVTIRLYDASKKYEQVYVKVTSWEGETIQGTLLSKASLIHNHSLGETLTCNESEVLDWTISRRDGTEEGNFVGKFLDTYKGTSGTSGEQPAITHEHSEVVAENKKAIDFNALATKANTAIARKDWQEAIGPLQRLVAGSPDNWQYYSGLGDAQLNLGQYDEAVDTYQKGIQLAEGNTTVDDRNPATEPAKRKLGEAHMCISEGNAYLKLKKNSEAVAAYTKAAALDPNPAAAYFNLCIAQYNTGNVVEALDVCDKAIATDPNRADAYFIKGSLLIAESKVDADGKVVAPPGTAEALNKYLQLAPNGPHADAVVQMLQYMGSKVERTYKKGK